MRSRILYSLTFLLAFSAAQAATAAKNQQEVQLLDKPVCQPVPVSKCWKPVADYLGKMQPPESEREFGQVFMAYLQTAEIAHWVKDFSDAKELNRLALEFAKKRKWTGRDADFNAALMTNMVNVNSVRLALSMGEYAQTLNYLDQFTSFWEQLGERNAEPQEFMLIRSAALIGLQRAAEAEVLLEKMLKQLNFSGRAPWEGNPLGLEPVNPYEAGRRIVAHYVRAGKHEQALSLLQTMDTVRTQTISRMPKEPVPGGYWAAMVDPTAMLDDQAAIYLKLGRDTEAEELLRASLLAQEKKAGKRLPLVMTRLAELTRRQGRVVEADALMLRVKEVPKEGKWEKSDPLIPMLAYIE